MPDSHSKVTSFAKQVNSAQHQAMQNDPAMLSFGLGIDDPKSIFDTTSGLVQAFGNERVFDMPTSENAMTGIGIGAALSGSRVLMTHQRLDFFLLAMDQLVNNAAKWHYMFNGQMKVPLTIRLIVGRGWGQGPTHAQNLQAWFAHIPGLKVVIPSKTDSVAQQLYQAIMDDNPVLFIEHRWLHNQQCDESELVDLTQPLDKVRHHKQGGNITLVANSYMLLEALLAADKLAEKGINCEVLETVQTDKAGWQPIYDSVNKTGNFLVCDSAHKSFSVAAELVASVTENCFGSLKVAPRRLGLPDHPEPTSYGMTKDFYNNADTITNSVCEMLGLEKVDVIEVGGAHDIPGKWFKGPF
ncbi:transketolase C-terminal domain-containing protein [Aliiglaciecola sp. LCG003]|uniref:alpha-ketoacid dehydrogenase subunit beta n=1 Tax=Aliiglaciecola sp. LCG003 TaxID=3053655 RepID=UPI0025726429|nr:transketolase C-terminal domain-containing protein [Aliiglaciecola sp. LCG003]WJG10590.1 transketolase C-terminal domain-containing protein [Aliiglaciecola sp. LCG003]